MSRRRWVGAASVVAAAVTGVLVVQALPGESGDSGERAVAAAGADTVPPGPATSEIRTENIAVDRSRSSAALPRQSTDTFSMLGVTWTDPSARVAGKVEVRTRATGSGDWSAWRELESHDSPDPGESGRGGTEPAWVGPSDGVEVRIDGKSGALPRGLRLAMIDPGTGRTSGMEPAGYAAELTPSPEQATPTGQAPTPSSPVPTDGTGTGPGASEPPVPSGSPAPTTTPPTTAPTQSPVPSTVAPSPSAPTAVPTTASPTPTPTAGPPSTAPRPPITSRTGWRADETISPEPPGYLPGGVVKAMVVHHTTGSSTYACTDGPTLVQGIYAYHVKERGWKDIGYNFLVDRCGVIYEGRKGGVDQPVMGAHSYGFNSETSGVSVLGDYDTVEPPQAVLTSLARLSAWKLGQYKVPPTGTAQLTAGADGVNFAGARWKKGDVVSRPAIHSHRDDYNTVCPGAKLYARLGAIRELAGGQVNGISVTSVGGATRAGSTYYAKGPVTVNWSATTPASLIGRYELLVDGKVVATAPATATSAKATLAAGTRTVQVRGVHQSGNNKGGASVTVVADATAPRFTTAPSLTLRKATVNATAVPLTLGWKAADTAALKEVRLTAPVKAVYGPTATSASHTAKPAATTAFALTAQDQAGNTASGSVSGSPVILQETSAAKTGTWAAKSSTSYLGGKSLSSGTRNASLTWTFTGRSAALVVSRAATSGQVHIYVDGKKTQTVDLKSTTTKYRDALWTQSWSTSGKHTVKIVVAGTTGRPTITTDGLVYLK
ncbi:peptidoglycan recognition protein family protein [Streptomyces yaizuensis]|uniref:N-acetylmuramoyl-L-alanine amidase n=1 Tax=Streptomyces yaizuensis TaxID=2989713 RepID=A0ABQ5NW51_9ACTN|nr:N-acetylmuramoyl-L-alanine amidase [Streptomyces sp. YSPA8]GLF94592.1 N-acetylmuramoyl-L-alanine amidase [Streptomyces sp. YSPA8]